MTNLVWHPQGDPAEARRLEPERVARKTIKGKDWVLYRPPTGGIWMIPAAHVLTVAENETAAVAACECGGDATGTTHSPWCPKA